MKNPKAKTKASPLLQAVMKGDLAAVQDALRDGEDVNGIDRDGRTALFQAIVDGRFAIAKALIQQGANVNARDRSLETPLHFAAREQQVELGQLLLDNGAEINATDSNGNTPLSRAVFSSQGRGEMIKLLLSHSADKNLKNNYGVSPQDLANTIANYDVKKFLQ
jgi:ankyrin repeat protein